MSHYDYAPIPTGHDPIQCPTCQREVTTREVTITVAEVADTLGIAGSVALNVLGYWMAEVAPDAEPTPADPERTPCVHGRNRTVRCRLCEREGLR